MSRPCRGRRYQLAPVLPRNPARIHGATTCKRRESIHPRTYRRERRLRRAKPVPSKHPPPMRNLECSDARCGYGAWSHGSHGSTHSLLGNRLMPMTIPYLWAYGMYFLCKMIYYGYQRITDYCIAEIMGSASFFFMLVLAIHSGSATAFVIPWIAHPIVFCSCFVWHFRRELRAGWKRQIDRGRRNAYLRYGFNWLTASASGLGAYHLSILFTKMLQADAAAVC